MGIKQLFASFSRAKIRAILARPCGLLQAQMKRRLLLLNGVDIYVLCNGTCIYILT